MRTSILGQRVRTTIACKLCAVEHELRVQGRSWSRSRLASTAAVAAPTAQQGADARPHLQKLVTPRAGTHESLCMHTHTYDREEEITGFSCACSPPIWPVNPISSQYTNTNTPLTPLCVLCLVRLSACDFTFHALASGYCVLQCPNNPQQAAGRARGALWMVWSTTTTCLPAFHTRQTTPVAVADERAICPPTACC